jgi:glycosyltransferase involved in cell wall biosynthesis
LKENHRPDVICLSNALLAGLARNLKSQLHAPVVCMLQGEDSFLDSLPEPHRSRTWTALSERCEDVDSFIAPSHYFAELMTRRLRLRPERVHIVYNGINLDGFHPPREVPNPPVIGYFARMCREKGLHILVDAFIKIKKENRIPGLKLMVGGGLGPADEPFVSEIKKLLEQNGLLEYVEFFPNVSREEKQRFFRKLSIFSVPALYGEAFGLYLVEAWASGVPAVQPRHAAFPELIQLSGAGMIVDPEPNAIAAGLESILSDPAQLASLRAHARAATEEQFSSDLMTDEIIKVLTAAVTQSHVQERRLPVAD